MSALTSWLRFAARTLAPAHHRRAAAKNRVRLALEALEDRAVPTVAFTPHFSGTAVSPPAGDSLAAEQAASLKSPPVVIIFAGSDWATTQGQTNQQTLLTSVKDILGSKYLSALDQYGSDGKANFFSTWQTNSTPTLTGNTPTGSDLHTFVNNQIANEKKTNASLVPSGTALYFVLNDPKDSGTRGGTFGFNDANGTATHVAYVGVKAFSSGALRTYGFTMVFSHELAEAMAPAIHVNDPGNLGLGAQISDGEPENFGAGYGYAIGVNREYVQAYWSQRDGAWVVPDGNSQVVRLNWDTATFNNNYNLEVDGDQLGANFNDTLTLTRSPVNGGTRVILNNEVFSFDPGQTPDVHLYSWGGSNTVNVQSVLPGQSVWVDSLSATSNDSVVVGNNGSLANIQGTLNVANSSGGKTNLTIQSWADGPEYIRITDHAITAGSATINYTPYAGPSSGVYGVMGVTIDDAYTQNYIDAESVPAYVPITVEGNPLDVLYGPAANKVHLYRWHMISNPGF
jgi:hypothetical protein